jgi:DNA-binding response OmpR family regulator
MTQEGKKSVEPRATVILVDDDPDVIEQVGLTLKQEGCEVRSADNVADAEELLLSVRPDLAILDVMMDERDSGFVLCHELKKLYPDAPVIILTAVKAATGISFAATTGEEKSWVQADCILDKPVQAERLKAEVRRLLRRPEPRPEAH